MSPATADPAERVTEAEKALEQAEAAVREAEGQQAELEGQIEELEAQGERASRKIREKHSAGHRQGITELRRKRRQAKAEAADLRDELPALKSVVAQRKRARDKAQGKVELARAEVLHGKAQELGTEIVEGLEELEARVLEMEELNAELGGVHSTLRHSLDHRGPVPGGGGAYSAAGLEPVKGFLRALREEVDGIRRRSRRHG